MKRLNILAALALVATIGCGKPDNSQLSENRQYEWGDIEVFGSDKIGAFKLKLKNNGKWDCRKTTNELQLFMRLSGPNDPRKWEYID